jgi:hypothetical protein
MGATPSLARIDGAGSADEQKEKTMNKLPKKTMEALKKAGIIKIKAVSGADADVETAAMAPGLCRVHATSGKRYALKFSDRFELEEIK